MIRIIKGTYGLEKGGVVRPMTKHSEPFKLSEAREAELVAAGVAVYVEETTKTKEKMAESSANETGVSVSAKRSRRKRQGATDEL